MCEKNTDFEFLFQSLKDTVEIIDGYSINPTVLIADGAEDKHNCFSKVFTLLRRIMCWDHIKINVHTKYTLNKQYQQMKHDIDIFEHATTVTMFEKASNLFV